MEKLNFKWREVSVKHGNRSITSLRPSVIRWHINNLHEIYASPSTGEIDPKDYGKVSFWLAAAMALHAETEVPCRIDARSFTGHYKVNFGPKFEFYMFCNKRDFK